MTDEMNAALPNTEHVKSAGPILFYDGECGFCACSIQWCLRRDRKNVLRFAPLQGESYAALPVPGKPQDMQSMVLVDDNGIHVRSDAGLLILKYLGGVWRFWGALGRVIPPPIRDGVYRWIANHRRELSKKVDACPMPDAKTRARFLP